MSAIWGAISLEKNDEKRRKRLDDIREKMRLPYEECIIDRFEEKTFDIGFFACGLQYFKSNSKEEVLPICDDEGFIFTGDIVLNGRQKLISEITESCKNDNSKVVLPDDLDNVPDGLLAYISWRLWKENFVDHIQGLFAIAVFNSNSGYFHIFADHAGTRCIHYCICDKELYFSTLIKPILNVMPKDKYEFDDKFIAACECSPLPIMFLYPEYTAFKNVYMVPRANFIEVYEDRNCTWKKKFKEYWNPSSKEWLQNRKKFISYSDDEFRKSFRDVFFESVKDAIDTDGGIAATLSSGLDSSSVATVAASLLPADKNIFAYTAVPIKEYKYEKNTYAVSDETEGAKKIVSGYKNIIHNCVDCEGISAFTELDTFVHRYEIPGKAFVNHIWMDYIASKAKENGCKVLLNGQFGNYTISNGDIMEAFFQELYDCKFGKAKQQIASMGRKYGIPKRDMLRWIFEELLKKGMFSLGLTRDFDKIFDDIYVRHDIIKKYHIKSRLRSMFRFNGYTAVNSSRRMTRHMFNFNILQTQGLYDTKLSLYRGILLRDPTKDKRVIEFCSLIPSDQFVKNGTERRLVREYLCDFIPDEIRLDVNHRGRQGADMAIRLNLYGAEKIKDKICPEIVKYMNLDKVEELLSKELVEENALNIVRILALNSFVNMYKKKES